MPTLAPKLPWTHAFAGGYPRLGGQPLPTDPDAIDYLERVAAADGAAVEVGVAMAVDAFVKGCKADGTWSAIKASCIMCGARTISGALVPLVGDAPTPYNFASGDYDRETGLKGNSSTKYLDSNRAGDSDGQNDFHLCVYSSTAHDPAATPSGFEGGANIGNGVTDAGASQLGIAGGGDPAQYKTFARSRSAASALFGPARTSVTFQAQTRSISSEYVVRVDGANYTNATASETPLSSNLFVLGRNDAGSVNSPSNARLAFYSIGSALDLAALDSRVSTLVAAIAAAI